VHQSALTGEESSLQGLSIRLKRGSLLARWIKTRFPWALLYSYGLSTSKYYEISLVEQKCTTDEKILDVGCGKSLLFLDYPKANILKVDIDRNCVDFQRQLGFRAEVMDIEEPQLREEFDTAVALSSLEHTKNLKLAIVNMLNLAKRVIIVLPSEEESNKHNLTFLLLRYKTEFFSRSDVNELLECFRLKNYRIKLTCFGNKVANMLYKFTPMGVITPFEYILSFFLSEKRLGAWVIEISHPPN
jgi:SAM-dependent methyltransferase